jgi:dGTPase
VKSPRERTEARERETLAPWAAKSAESKGRDRPEEEDRLRTAWQRDRDRILHSKAFRRLAGKTQVFLSPEGDHYRTRLTHTLEVAQISRTVARALALNEDLTEAIALGHDLGHTPFGHAGEAVLARLHPQGFHHSRQSLRVVEVLEYGGRGLNLTWEVRDGIRRHSKGLGRLADVREKQPAGTLEAEVVRLCDCVAYANHDLDDAIRAGFVRPSDIPRPVIETLGDHFASRINTIVRDIVATSEETATVAMSPRIEAGLETLRTFLVERVYTAPVLREIFERAQRVLEQLWHYYRAHPDDVPAGWPGEPEQRICDYLAGMTDRFALSQFQRHLVPHPWPDED